MGRSVEAPELVSHLRELRVGRGFSQQALAERVGLTRQSISAIEGGQYVPNTAVALRLARALDSEVEELFSLAPDLAGVAAQIATDSPASQRLTIAKVGARWIGYPLADGREIQHGFAKADAVRGTANVELEMLAPPEQLQRTAVVFGCDPSLGIVGAYLAARSSETRLLWLSAASQASLDAVASGEAHIAGTHLHELPTGDFNISHARGALASDGGLVVEFARWEQGFVVMPGNPKRIRAVVDLARPDVCLVNREEGSGTRALLDELLAREHIPSTAVLGYERSVGSHLAAAVAVASGAADGAVSLRAMAEAFGLDFVPLEQVRFDFVIPRAHLDHPAVSLLLELLQSRALRAEIGALAGYDVAHMGEIRANLHAA